MKKYDEIKFMGLDWYVIDTNENTTKLLLKNVLDEERIKAYADDEFMIDGHDVRHQDNIRPFGWDKSYIKNVILPNFIKDLGIECEVDLLSKEEVEELPEEIRKCDDWYWTKTPYSSYSNIVWCVNSSGYVSSSYGGARNVIGVRPVLVIDNALLDSEGEFIDIEEYKEKLSLDSTFISGTELPIRRLVNENRDMISDLIKNQKQIIERINNDRNN